MPSNQPNQTVAVVKTFIEEELGKGRTGPVDENTDLIKHGVIDSMSLLRLVTFLEQNCQIQIQDEEMVPENFRSLSAIQAFVAQHQAAREPRRT